VVGVEESAICETHEMAVVVAICRGHHWVIGRGVGKTISPVVTKRRQTRISIKKKGMPLLGAQPVGTQHLPTSARRRSDRERKLWGGGGKNGQPTNPQTLLPT